MSFYSRLKLLRKQKGYTIREVSDRSGVSTAYISQLENGNRGIPSPDILKRLSEGLNTSYSELMRLAGYYDEQIETSHVNKTPVNLRRFIRDNDILFDGVLLSDADKELIDRVLSAMFWRDRK